MAGLEGRECTIGCARTCAGSGSALASGVRALGSALTGSNHDSLGDLLFAHTFAANLSFFTNLTQAVFAGNSGDCCDEREPSVRSFNFVEAQDQARVQTWFNRAHMTFDFLAAIDDGPVGSEKRFGKAGVEAVSSLRGMRVDAVGELDEDDGALRNNVWRGLRRLLCE